MIQDGSTGYLSIQDGSKWRELSLLYAIEQLKNAEGIVDLHFRISNFKERQRFFSIKGIAKFQLAILEGSMYNFAGFLHWPYPHPEPEPIVIRLVEAVQKTGDTPKPYPNAPIYLDLADINLCEWPFYTLVDGENLKTLDIWGNCLEMLPPDAFTGLKNLTYLDISGNQLRALPSNVFADAIKLKKLFLDNNQLENCSPDALADLRKLEWLNLARNRLTKLPVGLFSNLDNISEICLRGNCLSVLELNRIQEELPKPTRIIHSGLNLDRIRCEREKRRKECKKAKQPHDNTCLILV